MLTGLLVVGHRLRRRPHPRPPSVAPMVEGLDVDAFERLAQTRFRQLQAAWDAADQEALARLTLGPLCHDLCEQLYARGGTAQHTEVLELHARLLAVDRVQTACLARVEFSGHRREQAGAAACRFRELWWLAHTGAADPAASESHGDGAAAWQVARVLAVD
ncbi:MAG: hypothetical protein ABIX12_13380 [Rubrivivax sp.]